MGNSIARQGNPSWHQSLVWVKGQTELHRKKKRVSGPQSMHGNEFWSFYLKGCMHSVLTSSWPPCLQNKLGSHAISSIYHPILFPVSSYGHEHARISHQYQQWTPYLPYIWLLGWSSTLLFSADGRKDGIATKMKLLYLIPFLIAEMKYLTESFFLKERRVYSASYAVSTVHHNRGDIVPGG